MNLKASTSILFGTKKAKFVKFNLFSYSGPKTTNILNLKFAISQEPLNIFQNVNCVELLQSRRKIIKNKNFYLEHFDFLLFENRIYIMMSDQFK